MKSKSHISDRTKKILLGTGITFGTILVFVVSFFLAFTLIVNPISFNTFGSDDVAAENEELKEQVQTLEDEVEHLNATVEKYKNTESAPVVDSTPSTVTTPSVQTGNTSSSAGTAQTSPPASSGGEGSQGTSETDEQTTDANEPTENFSPDTVTTPEGGFEPEVEPDITVIDISE